MANLVESMNKAIECNNIGVDLLRAGRLDEAIETFKGAAEVMYPVSRVLQLSQAYVFRPTQSIQVDVRESEILKKARSRLSSLCQSAASSSKLGCINCFIYVDPKKIEPMVCDPASCTLESATVVYNMGLTYHLQGSAACLQKALCLFDMAFDLVSSADSYASSSEIAMAALNNAGEIHHAVGHYQLSRQYLNTLSAFILRLPNSECKKTRWERHQFLLNAMLLQEPRFAGAA
jgi:tetratricopeptide (TPR) repeat protein|uniref:Uncharacterized protein n=1 Tax=Phaeodactylum tricornutum TaxID=2850 RepID=A0A8J9T475_PHATR